MMPQLYLILECLREAVFVFWVGVSASQSAVTMEMQPGQDSMVPLILNAGESHSLQLSPTSPPLSLSQVGSDYHLQHPLKICRLFSVFSVENRPSVQAADVGLNVFPVTRRTSVPDLLLASPPQAAISAMNLEQQLSQYAFFNQQPSNQNQQVSHVPQNQQRLELRAERAKKRKRRSAARTCSAAASTLAAWVCCLLADCSTFRIRCRGLIKTPA